MTMTSSAPRAVLGIDAAWTATQPSGVALAVETENGWRLAAVEASYDHFLERANGAESSEKRPRGSEPDAAALLEAARKICGRNRKPASGKQRKRLVVDTGLGKRSVHFHRDRRV